MNCSLNGEWKFKTDPDCKGTGLKWHESEPPDTVPVRVPSVWNESAAPGYEDGYAWYFKVFKLGDTEGKAPFIRFGAVNISCDVWLNGVFLDRHEGGYTPFDIGTGKAAVKGDNFLAVRVGHELTGNAVSKETWYYKYGGIWQDVGLVIKEAVFISSCAVRTENNGRVTACLDIVNLTEKEEALKITAGIAAAESPAVVQASLEMQVRSVPGHNSVQVEMHIPFPRLWGVDDPYLYFCSIVLEGTHGSRDQAVERFGFREFKVENGKFMLNGSPIILKGVLYQPNHAMTYIYPESREYAYREVRMVKEAGFNTIRAHIKPAHPWTLDAADEIGILVYEEPGIGWMSLPSKEEAGKHGISAEELLYVRMLSEIAGMVKRDINRPSVVIWGILNEGGYKAWDYRYKAAGELKRLDPTRMVIDDACIGTGERLYWNPYEDGPHTHWHAHPYRPCPVSGKTFGEYSSFGKDGMLNFVSEFGFGGFNDLPEVVAEYRRRGADGRLSDYRQYSMLLSQLEDGFYRYRLDEVFDNIRQFIDCSQQLQADEVSAETLALRINRKVGGYIFTQWNDAAFEMVAGLVDPWRRPKRAFHAFKAVNAPLSIVLRPEAHSYYKGRPLSVGCYLINENHITGSTRVVVSISKDRLPVHEAELVLEAGGQDVQRLDGLEKYISGVGLEPGYYKLEAYLKDKKESPGGKCRVLILEPITCKEGVISYKPFGLSPETVGYLEKCGCKPSEDSSLVISGKLDGRLLAEAAAGKTFLFLTPPTAEDAACLPDGVSLKSDFYMLGYYHYIRKSLLANGLPDTGIMGDIYAEVLPLASLMFDNVRLPGAEDLCGIVSDNFVVRSEASLDPEQLASGAPMGYDLVVFGNETSIGIYAEILSIPVGKGRAIYNMLRLTENVGKEPVAERLLYNLIEYANRFAGQ